MVKLKVTLIGKCPKCGRQLNWTTCEWQGRKITFVFCSDSLCRYARFEGYED